MDSKVRGRVAALAIALLGGAAVQGLTAEPAAAQGITRERSADGGLVAFKSDAELAAFLRRMMKEASPPVAPLPPPPPPAPPPPPPPAPPGSAPTPAAAPSAPGAPAAPGITNNQIQGVDEGGIVKLAGDILVVLRRGRLFTVSVADRGMRPISTIDAFPPGVNASSDWIDEMLISGDRVIVVGFSYRRGGTQVSRFRLAKDGTLSFEDSYHFRSADYYSAENYATRLVGNRLYLYAPLDLDLFDFEDEKQAKKPKPLDMLPAIRRWRAGDTFEGFHRVTAAHQVFIPRPLLKNSRDAELDTLHSVYDCDLTAPVLDCRATAVFGSSARTFFVSNNAVYLWVNDIWRYDEDGEKEKKLKKRANAFLYRVPLNGARPAAVGVRGAPIDQFSFFPDPPRNVLHVFVSASGGGDAMWNSEVTSGQSFALLSVPMESFGDGGGEVPLDRYTPMPEPPGQSWSLHNRFVAGHLLYARGSQDRPGDVTVVSLADKSAVRLGLTHVVDRIDAIGPDAVVLGSGKGFLGFTPIELRRGVEAGEAFRLDNARQGETRSHAFFYRPDPESADGTSGLFGLPVARNRMSASGAYLGNSAGILFLGRRGGRFAEAGQLNASGVAGSRSSDNCQASCIDWYGNARPIFLGERILALMGYELVEGAESGGKLRETGRTDFSPKPAGPQR
jgi:hypothetical protein